MTAARLSLFQAALVIARRDFVAVLFSRAFFFFLLGPLFPVAVIATAGALGGSLAETGRPVIAIAMASPDREAFIAAHEAVVPRLGSILPTIVPLDRPVRDPQAELARPGTRWTTIVSGTVQAPVLTGPAEAIEDWKGPVAIIAAQAVHGGEPLFPAVALTAVSTSTAREANGRIRTAQAAQTLMFMLTMLLAGMVLSNLVEEKSNKIIEILAAAIPIDAVFLGKLFAMLAVSLVAIAIWAAAGLGLAALAGKALLILPGPAVGWPLFFALGTAYFAMAYLLLGSIFLAVGALASTVRDVQTLSMPVTMMQLMVFFFATYALSQPGGWAELAAMAFPFSSPFAMIARAARDPQVWPHVLALAWQILVVAMLVRGGATLFRRRVMKSGGSRVRPWAALARWRARPAGP